jgi:predicted DNA-binding ribbon-helix-helix protein
MFNRPAVKADQLTCFIAPLDARSLLKEAHMKSLVVKRSIVIAGHKTSVSLEDAFWSELKQIAEQKDQTLSTVVGDIDTRRHQGNLSSAIRLFVLDNARNRATAPGLQHSNNMQEAAA